MFGFMSQWRLVNSFKVHVKNIWGMRLTLGNRWFNFHSPPFLFPSSGIIVPLILILFIAISSHYILYLNINVYIAWAHHMVYLCILTWYMPNHSLIGPWIWPFHCESMLACLKWIFTLLQHVIIINQHIWQWLLFFFNRNLEDIILIKKVVANQAYKIGGLRPA